MTRLLICGSRGWHDKERIRAEIRAFQAADEVAGEELVVIHGAAPKGADKLADQVCAELGIPVIREHAEWDRYGAGAGPKRNQAMLDKHHPDRVLAFRATGKSNGTDDMMRKAKRVGVPVTLIEDQNLLERV